QTGASASAQHPAMRLAASWRVRYAASTCSSPTSGESSSIGGRLSLRWSRGDAVVWVPRRARAAAPEAEVMTAGATTESREKTRVTPAPIVVEVRGSRPDADELGVDVEIAANADHVAKQASIGIHRIGFRFAK